MADDRPPIDIAQVVAEHHEAVYRYAYRLTGSAPDAEDLTQQVFLTIHEKLGQLRRVECTRGWLFAILRNRFFKARRKRRPTPAGSIALDVNSIPADPPPAEEIDREAIQQALDQLPPPHRVVLAMFYYEQCSYREIAEKLDLPIGTVMSRLSRAKAYLRSALFARDQPVATVHKTSNAVAPG
jgi:RNA polymerase sigma-70 factor (ECF subfamily)